MELPVGIEPTTLSLPWIRSAYWAIEAFWRGYWDSNSDTPKGYSRFSKPLPYRLGLYPHKNRIRRLWTFTAAVVHTIILFGAVHRIRTCKPLPVKRFQGASLTTRTHGVFGVHSWTWTNTPDHSDYSLLSKQVPYRLGLCEHMGPDTGLEPVTTGLRYRCSTDWANQAFFFNINRQQKNLYFSLIKFPPVIIRSLISAF